MMNAFILLAALGKFSFIVAFVGYLVVFIALVTLVFIFSNIPKLYQIQIRNKLRRKGKGLDGNGEYRLDISGETNAAIGLALFLYFNELHDHENMVITIDKVSKRYSPWSSKIYGLTNYNFRR
jgi:hypothetical protein